MTFQMPTDAEPVVVVEGDCREALPTVPADTFHACVCDPPYELGFMSKAWDRTGVAFDPATWAGVLRVLKPGGYMLAMGGTRTYHRLTCAVEDAGFEVRDCLMWLYGTGWPKGQGCLKPAYEPILLCRKPGPKVLPLGIDECRIPTGDSTARTIRGGGTNTAHWRTGKGEGVTGGNDAGRYPANVLHDGSPEVLEAFAAFGETRPGHRPRSESAPPGSGRTLGKFAARGETGERSNNGYDDTGSAARFFYAAKASKTERGEGNTHPTVKPLALCRWMVRLVCPAGGRLLDPFAGSGSTLVAAAQEGRQAVGVELDPAHAAIARKRVAEALGVGKGSLLKGLGPDLFAGVE